LYKLYNEVVVSFLIREFHNRLVCIGIRHFFFFVNLSEKGIISLDQTLYNYISGFMELDVWLCSKWLLLVMFYGQQDCLWTTKLTCNFFSNMWTMWSLGNYCASRDQFRQKSFHSYEHPCIYIYGHLKTLILKKWKETNQKGIGSIKNQQFLPKLHSKQQTKFYYELEK
jgi:hypothetical protein